MFPVTYDAKDMGGSVRGGRGNPIIQESILKVTII